MSRAVLVLAQKFRSALERAKALEPHIYLTLREFPHGACGDASLLLAKFLENNGQIGFDYVLGQRQERSHAWLRRSRLIVDITADQFADFSEPVFVARSSSWHRGFRGEVLHPADFEIYDEYTRASLRIAFRMVSKYVE